MNIAIIKNDLSISGGGERVCVNLANELAEFYSVSLINFYKNDSTYTINNNVNIFYLSEEKKRKYKSFCKYILNLRKYLKDNNIKFILVIGRNSILESAIAALGISTKVIFCEHVPIGMLSYNNFKDKFINYIVQKFINNLAYKIVLLTQKDKDNFYVHKQNVKKVKLINIYNFIDGKLLKKLKEYCTKNEKIITIGRIDYQKGYEYLVEVAKLVFEKHPDWQWHIYGDGEAEYKNKIIDLIKQNNLQNHIILQGNHSDIYDLYQDYSFYVMTSRYEGLPMVLLEAKAKKLPIVSFDINSGPSDIVRDGIDGFLIEPFDCNAMADKICELIENPEIRQKFSDNAHGNIDKFRKEKIIKQWCDLIENI